VAQKWKTVARSANLLAKKKCIMGIWLRKVGIDIMRIVIAKDYRGARLYLSK
jgi:hypothetical protein